MLTLFLFGCAYFDNINISKDSIEVQLYKSLKTSAIGYNAARETLREYDKVNPFSAEDKAKIELVGEKYRMSYHLALESWDLYEAGKNTNVDWMAKANDALDVYAKFKELIK